MSQPWTADIDITLATASELIGRQFPKLAPVHTEPFGVGWDNVAYLVNGVVVFRFPRRQVALRLLETEMRVLPFLAPYLPLAIPSPVYVGSPTAAYPHPFTGYPLIAGTTACRACLTDTERRRSAAPLGCFLAVLHGIPSDAPDSPLAVPDELGRAQMHRRLPHLRNGLLALEGVLPPEIDIAGLCRTVEEIVQETPDFDGRPAWVHGDLYPRHVVIDNERNVCGVIDWGDVHQGDSALDLSIAFTLLPPTARDEFREAYGPVDPSAWRRARFRAIHYGAILTAYGVDVGDDALRGVGEFALRWAAL